MSVRPLASAGSSSSRPFKFNVMFQVVVQAGLVTPTCRYLNVTTHYIDSYLEDLDAASTQEQDNPYKYGRQYSTVAILNLENAVDRLRRRQSNGVAPMYPA